MKTFKSGKHANQGHYESFQPNLINRKWQLEDMELITMLSQADLELGRLDMYSEYVPNIDLFIRMHVLKEATQSSKIEGTQTNMEEAVLDKGDVALDKRNDWEEVNNYTRAMNRAIGELDNLPFSSRLIRNTHKILLQGVRGEHKLPGEFRTSQNWIGGASINNAVFIPPIHQTVPELMGDLENFLHNEDIHFPELMKIALAHYQFETIHPFLDGNGRVGRLMIPLYLVSKGVLKKPILYLSDFFEKNQSLYYDNLMAVRDLNCITRWMKFFLAGIIETAKSGIATFDKILKLKEEVESKAQRMGSKAANVQKILNHLYQRPYLNAERAREITGLSIPSCYKLISDLEEIGVLNEFTGLQRGRAYLFRDYIRLFD